MCACVMYLHVLDICIHTHVCVYILQNKADLFQDKGEYIIICSSVEGLSSERLTGSGLLANAMGRF